MQKKTIYILLGVVVILLVVGGYLVIKIALTGSGDDKSSINTTTPAQPAQEARVHGLNLEVNPTPRDGWYEMHELSGILLEKPSIVQSEKVKLIKFKLGMFEGGDHQVVIDLFTPPVPFGQGVNFYIPGVEGKREVSLTETLTYYSKNVGNVVRLKFEFGIDQTSSEGIYGDLMYGGDGCDLNCFFTLDEMYDHVEETLETIDLLKNSLGQSDSHSLYVLVQDVTVE